MAIALLSVSTLSANPVTEVKNPASELSTQIQSLLKENTFRVNTDMIANVRFTINNKGEIVVLSVETENLALEGFVKNRLNYKKADVANVKPGKVYTVPVRIKA